MFYGEIHAVQILPTVVASWGNASSGGGKKDGAYELGLQSKTD